MKITLKQLHLINFKGTKDLTVTLDDITNIYGDNETGKTTIFDAFAWLMFGKDSTDRTDFGIKTRNRKGKEIEKLDHEVSAILQLDSREMTLRKVYKEKWQKKKGAQNSEMTGHQNDYYINDVPLQEKEYQSRMSAILDEKIFKLLTNPFYFNRLNWMERRAILVNLAGELKDRDLAAGDTEFETLMTEIGSNTVFDQLKIISARKTKIKDDLKQIPTRVDEIERGKPDTDGLNFADIKASLLIKEARLAEIDEALSSSIKNNEAVNKAFTEKNKKLNKLRRSLSDIKDEVEQSLKKELKRIENHKTEITGFVIFEKSQVLRITKSIDTLTEQIIAKEARMTELRTKWNNLNQQPLPSFTGNRCPTCQQELQAETIEANRSQFIKNFNESKAQELSKITKEGQGLAAEVAELRVSIANFTADRDKFQESINVREAKLLKIEEPEQPEDGDRLLNEKLDTNMDYKSLKEELEKCEAELVQNGENAEVVNENLQSDKKTLLSETIELRRQLTLEEQIKKSDQRIQELNEQEKTLAQELSNVEKQEFTIERFTKLKMGKLEEEINKLFSFVRFKLFDTQINGQEIEVCETLINGVPFADANNASKINAGIDIINTLCKKHEVYAPVFIDNAESVNSLLPLNSQLIRLVVTLDKKLRIEALKKI